MTTKLPQGYTPADAYFRPEDHERLDLSARAATWEGSVLPALREALDARPETRGRPVKLGGEDQSGRYVADIVLEDGTRCRPIRRDTAEHVRQDAWQIAFDMADIVHLRARERAARPPCPVCQALGGWRPRCGACEVAALGPEVLPPVVSPLADMIDRAAGKIAATTGIPAAVLRGDTPSGLAGAQAHERYTRAAFRGEVSTLAAALPPDGYLFGQVHGPADGVRMVKVCHSAGYGASAEHYVYSDTLHENHQGWAKAHPAAFAWAAHLLGEATPLKAPRFEPGQRVIVTDHHSNTLRYLVGQEATVRGNTGQTLILGFANGEACGWDPAHVRAIPSDPREQLCAAAS